MAGDRRRSRPSRSPSRSTRTRGRPARPGAPVDRLGRVPRGGTSLPDAVRRLAPGPGGIAYVAGEARDVQAVRRVLVQEAGWDRRAVLTKPFWTPGSKGMD
ncbi:SIP domain-containing protein [Streptomyces tremellae]